MAGAGSPHVGAGLQGNALHIQQRVLLPLCLQHRTTTRTQGAEQMKPSLPPSRLAVQSLAAFLSPIWYQLMEGALSPCLGYLGPRGSCLCMSRPHWALCMAGRAPHMELASGGATRRESGWCGVALSRLEPSSLAVPSMPCTTSSLGAQKPGTDSVCLGVLPEKGAEVLAPVITKLSEKSSCSDIISFLCYYKELRSYYWIGGNSIEPFKINSDRKRDMIA